MAILKDAKVLIDSFDFSGDTRALAMDYGAEEQDDTRFGDTTRSNAAGTLKTFAWNLEGFWKAGANEVDPSMFTRLGSTDLITTLIPESSTGIAGDVAYLYKGLAKGYQFGGSVGDNLPFTVNGGVRSDLVRGNALYGATVTATGNGVAVAGTKSSTQTLYGALHVVTAVGSTNDLTVIVQSDNSTAFGSPTNQLSFTLTNGIVSEWKSSTASSADTYWRASHTVAGATASFKYFVSVGVL